ncbi:MAG: type II toxin-antitoxin system VapB family antitoxin [Terracidiphilus sp.]|jgi:Arc/MetJ family transcription regulator
MRTNIDIDDELMRQAMAATGTTTKKAAVEASLRKSIQLKAQTKILDLCGKVVWRGADDDWFTSDEEILAKPNLAKQDTKPEGAYLPTAEQPAVSVEAH